MDIDPPGVNGASAGGEYQLHPDMVDQNVDLNTASPPVPPISDVCLRILPVYFCDTTDSRVLQVALLIERTAEFAESLEKSQTDHHAAMTLICERLHKLEDGRAPRSSSTDEDQPPEPRVSDLAKRRQAQSVKLAVRLCATPHHFIRL